MTSEFVDAMVAVPGGEVFTRRWGPDRSDRTPIVVLHDSLGSVELWREFPAALSRATDRRVVAYDRLGFGKSTPRSGPAAHDFIHQEAGTGFPAVADALGISRCVLFGHSVGGAMAIAIAALHPDRCEAVITESAQAFVEPRTLAGIEAAKRQFADPVQFAKLARWHGDNARWVLEAWTGVWLSPRFRSWTLDPCLGKVSCPVLVIHGDSDEFGSEAFPRRIADGVRGPSELEILAPCGHVPHRERQADVLRLASSFLRRRAAARQRS